MPVTRVLIVVDPALSHHTKAGEALQRGLLRHGIFSLLVDDSVLPPPVLGEFVACWGWRIGRALRALGHNVLVMERGFIGDRSHWCSLGWNGLNGNASFAPALGGERFEKFFGHLLKPWNDAGSYALVLGQVEGDASLGGLDFRQWATYAVAHAAATFKLPVCFRPHPLAAERGQWQTVDGARTLRGTLAEALDGARVVITYNSNSGVDAALAGKPTIAFDRGSMAWPVVGHEWELPLYVPRINWAYALAWSQFTLDEISDGSAWGHVARAQGVNGQR